jgi:2-iminobutanoate/2-iminopropanoate deaminase
VIKRVVIPPYDGYELSTFVINNDTVYMGHFGGVVDKDGNLLTTIEQQMEQTLMNLSESLEKIDLTLKNIVKLTVILRDIKDFHNMHSIWTKYFDKDNYPVRTVITSDFVSENCLVQIEGIACY